MFEPAPFHHARPGLVAPVRADITGTRGPTRGRARGRHWRTSSHGFFVPADVELTTEQRIVEAAAVLRPGEAVTGWAALRWERAAWFDGTSGGVVVRDVPVVATRDRAAQQGLAVSQEFLNPAEVVTVDGVPVTSAVRSVVYEMRYASCLGDAVVALDMACYSDRISLEEVRTYVVALGPVTGIQQARDALALGEENSWSPQETRMRGVWTRRAGLPRPRCNVPVFDLGGTHVGTPDMIDPVSGLVGLYHGGSHLELVGAAADLKKDAAYRDLGLEPVGMLASDWADLADFTGRLLAAARRVSTSTGPRGWTVEVPCWWTPTETVAQRRALTDGQRRRYLRYRRAA